LPTSLVSAIILTPHDIFNSAVLVRFLVIGVGDCGFARNGLSRSLFLSELENPVLVFLVFLGLFADEVPRTILYDFLPNLLIIITVSK
jgi:fumarate reductase subunit C